MKKTTLLGIYDKIINEQKIEFPEDYNVEEQSWPGFEYNSTSEAYEKTISIQTSAGEEKFVLSIKDDPYDDEVTVYINREDDMFGSSFLTGKSGSKGDETNAELLKAALDDLINNFNLLAAALNI